MSVIPVSPKMADSAGFGVEDIAKRGNVRTALQKKTLVRPTASDFLKNA